MEETEQNIVATLFIGNTRVKISDACCRNRTSEEVNAILARIARRAQEEISASQPQGEALRSPESLGRET